MRTIPLQAVATPVDIFAPDAVVHSGAGQGLLDLADSLGNLAPTLARYAKYRNEEDKKSGLEEAIQIQREKRFNNIKDFHSLVESGEIEEGENPWKLVFLRQLVAQEQVSNAALAIENDFYQNPPADPDDIVGIRDRIQRQMTDATKGLDSFEFQAVAGQVDDFVNQFTGRHQSRRYQERVLEADEALMNKLNTMTSGSDLAIENLATGLREGGPAKGPSDQFITELQGLADAAVLTSNGPRVRQRLLASIETMAVQARDPDLAKSMISRLTVGGQGLSESVGDAWYSDLSTRIDRAAVSDMRLAQARDAMDREAALQPIYQAITQAQAEGKNIFEVPLPSNLQPEAYEKINSLQKLLASRQAAGLLSDAAAEVAAGTFTKDDHASLGLALISLQQPSSTALSLLERMIEPAKPYADETDARTYIKIMKLRHEADRSPVERQEELLSLVDAGKVSRTDFNTVQNAIWNGVTPSAGAKQAHRTGAIQTLQNLVLPQIPKEFNPLTGEMEADPDRMRELSDAEIALMNSLWNYEDQNPEATTDELEAFTQKTINELSTSIGGLTVSQRDAQRAALRQQERFSALEDRDGTVNISRLNEGVLYYKYGKTPEETGYFFVSEDGTKRRRTGGAPRFTDNVADFQNPRFVGDLFQKIGIDPTDWSSVMGFLRSQRINYDPRTDPENSRQLDWYIRYLEQRVDLSGEPSP